MSYSPWGHKELKMTEATQHAHPLPFTLLYFFFMTYTVVSKKHSDNSLSCQLFSAFLFFLFSPVGMLKFQESGGPSPFVQ